MTVTDQLISMIYVCQTPAQVTIRVSRNNHPPVFQNEPYDTRAGDSSSVGSTVTTLRATDRDSGVFGVVKVTDTLLAMESMVAMGCVCYHNLSISV